MSGIFISKGITPGIKAGDLRITLDEHGKSKMDVILSLHFDVCPTWLKLSIDHLENAKLWESRRREAWQNSLEEEKSETLEREFEYSMQAIMAMAICYDALYSIVKTKIKLPKELTEKWRTNRTARHTQITETFRQAFKLNNRATQILKTHFKEIFRFRDMAIHPTGDLKHAINHPDLGVGVEWRFVYFRYSNAKLIVDEGIKRLNELLMITGYKNLGLQVYCNSLMSIISPLIQDYQNKFGQIVKR